MQSCGSHGPGTGFEGFTSAPEKFDSWKSLGERRRSTATDPSPDRNRPMFESWKQMDQVRYAHSQLWRD